MPSPNTQSAYTQTQNLGGSPRSTEARALLEAARRLNEAKALVERDLEGFRAALRLNWRLWTIIQCDVASAENPLPVELKSNIISLSIFVDRRTLAALADPSASKLDALIDINRNIAAGLIARPESGGAQEAAPGRSDVAV